MIEHTGQLSTEECLIRAVFVAATFRPDRPRRLRRKVNLSPTTRAPANGARADIDFVARAVIAIGVCAGDKRQQSTERHLPASLVDRAPAALIRVLAEIQILCAGAAAQ